MITKAVIADYQITYDKPQDYISFNLRVYIQQIKRH
jgi:hypothetical protein